LHILVHGYALAEATLQRTNDELEGMPYEEDFYTSIFALKSAVFKLLPNSSFTWQAKRKLLAGSILSTQ